MISARTRVLVNALHAKSGGGLTYVRNLLPLLHQHPELDIEIAVQHAQADWFAKTVAGCPLHILPDASRAHTVLWQEQVTLPRLARRIGAEVVFSLHNFGPLMQRPPGVVMLRNSLAVGGIDRRPAKIVYWFLLRALSSLSFRLAGAAIAVSNHMRDETLRVFGSSERDRVAVVYHGVGEGFAPPPDFGTRDPHRLLAVSDIYVQKNLETMIQALAHLVARYPETRLDIAGQPLDPDYNGRIEAQVHGLGLTDHVRFLGRLETKTVAMLYRRCRVFVFPSLVESFGNPLVEAMASGAPIVCSDASALPEIAGDAALLARPGDADHMAECIARLFEDPALARELGRRGAVRAQSFTWQRTAKETARVLLDTARKHL